MKIISLRYKDNTSKWELDQFSFLDLTLLVGASGVGKTKILKALYNLKRLALGKKSDNVEWQIKFQVENKYYCWTGKAAESEELHPFGSISTSEEKYIIASEKLVELGLDDTPLKIIFQRGKEGTYFKNNKVPKVTVTKSCIDIFSDEDDIEPVVSGFSRLFFFEFENERQYGYGRVSVEVDKDFQNMDNEVKKQALEVLREKSIPFVVKLGLAYNYFHETFEAIKEEFISVFNYIEDIRFRVIKENDKEEKETTSFELQIKEFGSNYWISEREISSGMLKTLLYLSMLHLVPRNSVILLDEFENSLGINCINLMSENVNESRNIQFILTSHHPYIINTISMNNWQIVSRKRNRVVVKNANFYGLGKSKHRAFKQLLNLDTYTQGRQE